LEPAPLSESVPHINKWLALKNLGVGEFAHLNGDLETHLIGTFRLLAEWGNPAYVCDAGLYHAVYGTQPMPRLGIPHREFSATDLPQIRAIIGEAAEHLVYLYGACDRDFFYPQIGSDNPVYRDRFTGSEFGLPAGTLRDLLEITIANELEICLSAPAFLERSRGNYVELFNRFKPLISVKAFRGYQEVFGMAPP
jgi:hypothetical protein